MQRQLRNHCLINHSNNRPAPTLNTGKAPKGCESVDLTYM